MSTMTPTDAANVLRNLRVMAEGGAYTPEASAMYARVADYLSDFLRKADQPPDNGGPAFPVLHDGAQFPRAEGMTLHDYAAVKFAAEWTAILGNTIMNESREQRGAEAVRLGQLQANAFIKARSA